jgi:hypothetical protein
MHLSQARISHITTRAPLWLSHCGVAVFEKGGPESACIWLSDFGANGQLGANGLSGPPHQASNFFQAAHRPMGVRRQSAMTQFPYQIKSSLLEKKLLQFFKYELHLTKRPDSLESEYGMSECQNLPQRWIMQKIKFSEQISASNLVMLVAGSPPCFKSSKVPFPMWILQSASQKGHTWKNVLKTVFSI